jgi:HSP20 family protein
MRSVLKPMLRDPGWVPATFRKWMDTFWDTDLFFDDEFAKGEWIPAVNILDKKDRYEIEVAAPGMKKADFDVTVENGVLYINAEHREEKKEEKENYQRREFAYNAFKRALTLPEDVKEESVEAKYEDGILRLVMKRTKPVEKKDVKKIAIK